MIKQVVHITSLRAVMLKQAPSPEVRLKHQAESARMRGDHMEAHSFDLAAAIMRNRAAKAVKTWE